MFKQKEDDLCWKYNDKYCDVTFSNVTGDWSIRYDGQLIKSRIMKRKLAENILKVYVATLAQSS